MSGFALLSEAIANRDQVFLSTGIDRSGQLVARLDGGVNEVDHTFAATITEGDAQLLDPMVVDGRPLEVSFTTPSARVFFDSIPLKRERKWFRHRLLLRWPEQLTVVERRSGGREPVGDDMPLVGMLSARLSGANLRGRLFDLSHTGAAFLCPIHPDLPKPIVGEGYAVILTHPEQEYRFNATCRHVQHLSSSSLKVGMEFRADKDLDPPSLARFKRMLEDMEASRIRRTFRSTLTKTARFAVL